MSEQEDAEALRTLFEAFNAKDRDGWLAALAPDVHLVSPMIGSLRDAPDFHGTDGAEELWGLHDDAFSETVVDIDTIRAVDGRYLLLGTFRIAGRVSGAVAERPVTMLCRRSGGRWQEVVALAGLEDALESLGLEDAAALPAAIGA